MNKLIKSGISIIASVLAISITSIFIVWIVVAQPTSLKNTPSNKKIDAGNLEKHVRVLSEQYHPRDYKHVENLDKCAAYILEHFKLSGATKTTIQTFDIYGKTYKNVIARFGSDNRERIIVGAHYDTFTDTPGADDNASGVAGLIELAYLLGKTRVKGDIELVAYALEEPPFFDTNQMGSAYHAESLAKESIDVKLMISLEMIGYFSDEKGRQLYPMPLLSLLYPGRGNYIGLVSNLDNREITKWLKGSMRGTTDLPVYSINAPSLVVGVDFSDHRNYWSKGYKAVMVTDTSFYRNASYHKESDTAEHLDYNRMGKVVIGLYEALVKLSAGR